MVQCIRESSAQARGIAGRGVSVANVCASMRQYLRVASVAILAMWSASAIGAPESVCEAGGSGTYCRTAKDCAGNALATVCVNSACAIPCQNGTGEREPTSCALGETCVQGETEAAPVWVCRASAFAMDLNLLDSCVGNFVSGNAPDLTSSNVCSMSRNLNRMLDQDGNGIFNIFDVDGCLRAYLGQEACTESSCSSEGVFCRSDDACGRGLYCNQSLHRCERECGLVASREQQAAAILERKCSRPLTVCDYDRGRCILQTNLSRTSCQVDNECPAGAVCSMGMCDAKCQRSTDCADSTWYCSTTNRCLPRPTAAAQSDFVFDPQAYSVLVGTKTAMLSAINSEAKVPLLIMDLVSKKQVFANAAVVFGYRLETKYGLKQDEKCLGSPIAQGDIDDCKIAPEEEFVVAGSPFGVVNAQGTPNLTFSLNSKAVERLSPGLYMATVSVYFSNGGQDSFTVAYRKASPSGLYSGRLSIYNGSVENLLGNTDVSMRLFVDRKTTKKWDLMLAEQGMKADGDIQDVTEGYFVVGHIDGNDSMVFDQPVAKSKAENFIPVRGLYSPKIGRMRLIAAVDVPVDFCKTDFGECSGAGAAGDVRITNPFGRPIRRVMHFVGPFDERALRFHGLYREVIHGLAPEARTLEGGFQLAQSKSDESPVCDVGAGAQCQHLPMYAGTPPSAEFPSHREVLSRIESEVTSYCKAAEMSDLAAALRGKEAITSYLGGLCQNGNGESCASYSTGRVLDRMVRLESEVQAAVESMKGTEKDNWLTLNDYLRDKIALCDGQKAQKGNCIDPAAARCAMAIHRRALLSGDVSLEVSPRYQAGGEGGAPVAEALFCGEGDRTVVGDRCRLSGAKYPTTVVLQEHNRFFKQLAEATRYQAANELSDALFAMYRAASNQLERAQVLSHKEARLRAAYGNFSSMATEMFSPVSTALLFQWPMARFDDHGVMWLKEFHSALSDRLQVVSALIDLKRRVLVNSSEADFAFVQHLMHMEYLSQAYLMFLQQAWQGSEFSYEGQGPRVLEQGQAIVARVTSGRNPLGLHPQQIFFENANIGTSNWKNYRAQVLGGAAGAGILGEVRGAVDGAVTNLKASLRDEAAFMSQLQSTKQQFEQTIDGLCGSADEVSPTTKRCEMRTPEEKVLARSCKAGAPGCTGTYACQGEPAGNSCASVVQTFNDTTGEAVRGTACDVSIDPVYAEWGGKKRLCMRGQMGDLINQREQLLLQRRQVSKQVHLLAERVARQARYIRETESANEVLNNKLDGIANDMLNVDLGVMGINLIADIATATAGSLDCMVIVGVAAGTNCPQKAVGTGLTISAQTAKNAALNGLAIVKSELDKSHDQVIRTTGQQAELRRERMALDNMVTEVQNLVAQYEVLTSSLFGVNSRIVDTKFLAEQAGRRADESTSTVVAHLLGGMNGDVLQRNKHVMQADAKFQDLLLATYKLTMAFVHSYNLQAQSTELVNRVFRLMTPDDVAEYLADLDRYEANYCGGAGIDCDSVNNVETFRFSVRDQLFPGLRDIVDARTGAVLSKGEQFHNIITSDAYLKSRERAGRVVKQIEIPFSVWLNDRGTNGDFVQQWMVSPLECNHIVAAGPAGTIAVNVIGTRLKNLTYELGRGNSDYIRQCEAVEKVGPSGQAVRDYPINTYIVGYAPQNSLAQRDSSPSYVTHSNGFLACKNAPESGGNVIANEGCFKFFARERSLGAPDWSLTIPFGVAYDNDWVFGADRPVIEDIVLYIRYRTRPI